MTLKEIRESRYLLCKYIETSKYDISLSTNHLVLIVEGVDNEPYKKFPDACVYRIRARCNMRNVDLDLVHYPDINQWQLRTKTDSYYVVRASNKLPEVLSCGDKLIYDMGVGKTFLEIPVVKYQAMYGRYIVECKGQRHNLTTIFKLYGDSVLGVVTPTELIV